MNLDSKKKGSWLKRRRSAEKVEINNDEDPLVEVKFKELLKLNGPDWYLVVPGIIFAGIQGAMFPLMAILFSDVLGVSVEFFKNLIFGLKNNTTLI